MKKDTLYAKPRSRIDSFTFDTRVADVFENMINRSVPGYSLILDLIGVLTEKFARPDTHCYDLGCSLGASTLMMRHHLPPSCHLIGVDNASAMVARCRNNIARDHSPVSVEILQQTLQDTPITNASVVVINFTLQFIADAERTLLLKHIADGMLEGGILILSEKIRFEDSMQQKTLANLHYEFKKYQGYSDLEILQKRAALENVLIPNTQQQHLSRLKNAGFSEVEMYLRCFNFASFLAIK